MNFISNKLKDLFIPLGILSLVFIFLFNDRVVYILMANFPINSLDFVYYGFFRVLFFVIFFIYILIPLLKILFNNYGSIIQRILLILSISSFWIIYLFVGFGTIAFLFLIFLAFFINFTSENFESTVHSYLISTSSLNILLMIYISIFLLLFYHYTYPYWISIFLSFLFVISSIFYSEKAM